MEREYLFVDGDETLRHLARGGSRVSGSSEGAERVIYAAVAGRVGSDG